MAERRDKKVVKNTEEDNSEVDSNDEDDVTEYLNLPDLLGDITFKQKRELLKYKQTHTEREWETEILRRQDLLARKVDMERLMRMKNPSAKPTGAKGKKGAQAPPKKGQDKAAKKKVSKKVFSDDSEEEDEDEESNEDSGEESEAAPKKKQPPVNIAPLKKSVTKKAVPTAAAGTEEEEEDEEETAEKMDVEVEHAASTTVPRGEVVGSDDELFDSDEEAEMSNKFHAAEHESQSKEKSKNKQQQQQQQQQQQSVKVTGRLSRGGKRSNDVDVEEGEEVEVMEEVSDVAFTDDDEPAAAAGGRGRGGRRGGGLADVVDSDDDEDDANNRSRRRNKDNSRKQRESNKKRKNGHNSDNDDDEDDDNNSNNDYDEEEDDDNNKDDDDDDDDDSPEAGLDQYLRVQCRRSYIEKWLHEPFFEEAVVDCFVRLFIAEKEGIAVYRMALVTGIETVSRAYRLTDSNTSTTLRLVLDIAGSTRRHVKIDLVSNSRITAQELRVYLESVRASRVHRPLTVKALQLRRQHQQQVVNHKYTHEEINAMVHKKLGLNRAVLTETTTAIERLHKLRTAALLSRDFDEADKVGKAIEKMEEKKLADKDLFERSSSFKYVSLNQRNKNANFEKDQRAGVNKRKKDLEALTSGASSLAAKDPFIRRETRPQNIWKTGVKLEHEKAVEILKKEVDTLKAVIKAGEAEGEDVSESVRRLSEAESELTGITVAAAASGASGVAVAVKPVSGGNGGNGGGERGRKRSASVVATTARTTATMAGEEDSQSRRNKLQPGLEQVRQRVKARLGVDPFAVFREDRRDRYLKRVCAGLAPLGSDARERQRGGMSLTAVLQQSREAAEEEHDGDGGGGGDGEEGEVVVGEMTGAGGQTVVMM